MTGYKQHYITVIMEHYFSETTNYTVRIIYKNPVQILLFDIFIIEIGSGFLCAT